METKLDNNLYATVEDFSADMRKIFDNCKRYNGEISTYTDQARNLEKAFGRIMKKRQPVA